MPACVLAAAIAPAVIAALAAVGGAIVAGVFALLGAYLQRRWGRQDAEEARRADDKAWVRTELLRVCAAFNTSTMDFVSVGARGASLPRNDDQKRRDWHRELVASQHRIGWQSTSVR
jgi:hypothetical protein